MLRLPEGATVDEVASVTGWQRHTVRGVFSGTLKKKLGLTLASAKEERGRARTTCRRRVARHRPRAFERAISHPSGANFLSGAGTDGLLTASKIATLKLNAPTPQSQVRIRLPAGGRFRLTQLHRCPGGSTPVY